MLGLHHFAFLRAVIQGLEPRQAWQRYLAFGGEAVEPRRVQRLHQALWADVLERAQWRCAGLPADAPPLRALRVLQAPAAQVPVAQALPSLEEFIALQGLDPDQYSQAELLQEYTEHYALNSAPKGDPAEDGPAASAQHGDRQSPPSQLRALSVLSEVLVQHAAPTDPLGLWLAPSARQCLQAAGLQTLGALAARIQQAGVRWWQAVPRLGRTRAEGLTHWLQIASESWPQPLEPLDWTPEGRARQRLARWPEKPLPAVPRPLRLAVDPARAARASSRPSPDGAAPSGGNPEGAACWQLAQAWLAAQALGPASQRAYGKEAERFVLWCALQQRQPLARVRPADLQAYAAFLAELPPQWVQPEPLPRTAARWRPFRGPLSPASQRYALALVQRLVAGVQGRAQSLPDAPVPTHQSTPSARPDRRAAPSGGAAAAAHDGAHRPTAYPADRSITVPTALAQANIKVTPAAKATGIEPAAPAVAPAAAPTTTPTVTPTASPQAAPRPAPPAARAEAAAALPAAMFPAVQRRRALLAALSAWHPAPNGTWAGAVLCAVPLNRTDGLAGPAERAPAPAEAEGVALATPTASDQDLHLQTGWAIRLSDGALLHPPSQVMAAVLAHHQDLANLPGAGQLPRPLVCSLRGRLGRWTFQTDDLRFTPGKGREGGGVALSAAGLRRVQGRVEARAGAPAQARAGRQAAAD